jgi:hypothetical protein
MWTPKPPPPNIPCIKNMPVKTPAKILKTIAMLPMTMPDTESLAAAFLFILLNIIIRI